MTVNAWIEHLKRFDPGMDVVVSIENWETDESLTATKPVFASDISCDGEFVRIALMHEDEGIEEVEASLEDLPEMPKDAA